MEHLSSELVTECTDCVCFLSKSGAMESPPAVAIIELAYQIASLSWSERGQRPGASDLSIVVLDTHGPLQ